MDWAKAKNILIVLLFALNIILAGVIVSRAVGGGADRELFESVMRIIESRGVTINCSLPKQITSFEMLKYLDGLRYVEQCKASLNAGNKEYAELLGRESLRYSNGNPDENLNTENAAALDADIRKALAEKGVDLSGFIKDYDIEGGDGNFYYRYILDFKGMLVFDCNVNVTVSREGGISEITINYRDVKKPEADTLAKIMPVHQVILKNYYKSGDVIDSISIGFIRQSSVQDNPYKGSDEGAVWRIRLDDGSERFFTAAYGDEVFLYSQS